MGLFNIISFEEKIQLPDGIVQADFQSKDFEDYDDYKITKSGQIVRTYNSSSNEEVNELLKTTFVLNIYTGTPIKFNPLKMREAHYYPSKIHEYDLYFEKGVLTYIFCYQTEQKIPFISSLLKR